MKDDESYDSWTPRVRLWERCTSVPVAVRTPAIALMIEGASGSVALKIPVDDLSKEGGTEVLLNNLDDLFSEDKDQMAFNVYDTFEMFRRSEYMSMKDYMVRFDVFYESAIQCGN